MPHQLGLAPPAPQHINRTTCPRWQAGKQLPHHHGTEGAERMGCRCPDARTDRLRKAKRRKLGTATPGLVPSLGVQRRIRALARIGHSQSTQAAVSGLPVPLISHLRANSRLVQRRTHDAMVTAYEELRHRPGASSRAASSAARKGWPGPLSWDDIDDPNEIPDSDLDVEHDLKSLTEADEPDENVVDALWTGRVSWDDMAPQDREYAAWRLNDTWSAAAIARETRVTRRTVERALRAARTRWGASKMSTEITAA